MAGAPQRTTGQLALRKRRGPVPRLGLFAFLPLAGDALAAASRLNRVQHAERPLDALGGSKSLNVPELHTAFAIGPLDGFSLAEQPSSVLQQQAMITANGDEGVLVVLAAEIDEL
jgi:hypothetical protein